jgi:predicted acyltransferase
MERSRKRYARRRRTEMITKSNRAHALDALRGYAIMTMILSATEVFNILPRWMYHAQVPPPDHIFNPAIYGITWVDLIFPFFLFSMGAAIPLSLGRQFEKGESRLKLVWKSVVRWMKLIFFSIYIIHCFPFMLGYDNETVKYAMSFVAFLWMFVMFMRNPFHLSDLWNRVVNGASYAIAILLLLVQPYSEGKPFSLYDSDIIILILANVSLVGSVIYLCTIHRPVARLALIPLIMALFMSSKTDMSWQQWLYDFTPAAWLYKFSFLEYLLIIIPGTVAGELLTDWLRNEKSCRQSNRHIAPWTAVLAFSIIVTNVVCLYNRLLILNLILSLCMMIAMWLLLRKADADASFWFKLCKMGCYFLLLGLVIEAFEGGIRKDDVTMSYLFVTTGLAFMGLLFFSVISDYYHVRCVSVPLEMTGKNPMVAYVASSMVVIPLLSITDVYPLIDSMSSGPWTGFLKGVLLTSLSMGVASLCTWKRWFWKT